MSSQPLPMDRAAQQKRAARRSDALYVAGAVLVTVGVGMFRIRLGMIVAGGFCLLLPLLEISGSFIRGLRTPRRG
jgi:hypothetical protein